MKMYQFHYYNLIPIFVIYHTTIATSSISKVNVQSENHTENSKTIEIGNVCDKTIEENQFYLNSPNYPKEYPHNLNCHLNLKGKNCPTYYKFHFIDFNIQKSPGCVEDRLEIGLVDALCGSKNGTKTYLAKNGTLPLVFETTGNNSSKRFRILVTRVEECADERSEPEKNFAVSKNVHSNLKECCLDETRNAKHFILKSPNFPLSLSYPTDCILQIHKANPDVCRLRIIFRFFWFGNSRDCSESFLQIDGKVICGCRTDLKLTSRFDENVKTLRFRSGGFVKNSYSGFVAEIFQDECPKKLTDIGNKTILELPKKDQDLMFDATFQRRTDKNYVYGYTSRKTLNEREPSDFLATEDINRVLGSDANDFDNCMRWNQEQFNEIFYGKEIKLEQCRSAQSRKKSEEKKCATPIHQSGFILSPGYPFFYPGNLNICYRFPQVPGTCGVRLHFYDFRIGGSQTCSQDRFKIEEREYCGIDLWNKIVMIDFRYKQFVDMDFITSSAKCIQGFKAFYEYLPCEEPRTETPIPPPITRIFPVTPPVTEIPRRHCGGVVKEEIFTLTNDEGSQECVFIIEKITEEVCQLLLNFERSSIDCNSEFLKINGKPYCGNQIDHEVSLAVEEFPVEIQYRHFGYKKEGTRFRIRGIQDTISCLIPEPPAQLN